VLAMVTNFDAVWQCELSWVWLIGWQQTCWAVSLSLVLAKTCTRRDWWRSHHFSADQLSNRVRSYTTVSFFIYLTNARWKLWWTRPFANKAYE